MPPKKQFTPTTATRHSTRLRKPRKQDGDYGEPTPTPKMPSRSAITKKVAKAAPLAPKNPRNQVERKDRGRKKTLKAEVAEDEEKEPIEAEADDRFACTDSSRETRKANRRGKAAAKMGTITLSSGDEKELGALNSEQPTASAAKGKTKSAKRALPKKKSRGNTKRETQNGTFHAEDVIPAQVDAHAEKSAEEPTASPSKSADIPTDIPEKPKKMLATIHARRTITTTMRTHKSPPPPARRSSTPRTDEDSDVDPPKHVPTTPQTEDSMKLNVSDPEPSPTRGVPEQAQPTTSPTSHIIPQAFLQKASQPTTLSGPESAQRTSSLIRSGMKESPTKKLLVTIAARRPFPSSAPRPPHESEEAGDTSEFDDLHLDASHIGSTTRKDVLRSVAKSRNWRTADSAKKLCVHHHLHHQYSPLTSQPGTSAEVGQDGTPKTGDSLKRSVTKPKRFQSETPSADESPCLKKRRGERSEDGSKLSVMPREAREVSPTDYLECISSFLDPQKPFQGECVLRGACVTARLDCPPDHLRRFYAKDPIDADAFRARLSKAGMQTIFGDEEPYLRYAGYLCLANDENFEVIIMFNNEKLVKYMDVFIMFPRIFDRVTPFFQQLVNPS